MSTRELILASHFTGMVDGELWRYDRWVAWIHDSQIRELWAAN